MDKYGKENSFLISIGVSIIILLVISFFGFDVSFRGTYAYFPGGMTGVIGNPYKVIYSSNWPYGTIENEIFTDQKTNKYVVRDNMFLVPDGYKFVGWVDKDGNQYLYDDNITLTADLELSAIWELLDNEIEVVINYGDVNKNLEIDEEDYLLISDYLSGTYSMDDEAKISADVNVDGKIDLVDVDIIKQVCLGNILYMGKLPNEPIFIYDIYEGSIDVGNGSVNGSGGGGNIDDDNNNLDEDNDKEDNGNNNNNINSGVGNGSNGNKPSVGSGNSGSSNHENNVSDEDENNDEEVEIEIEKKYYYFTFMDGNLEYRTTRCEITNDGDSCDLVLPDNPSKDGYKFNGWSMDKSCGNGSIIKKSIKVNSNNTYYACFILLDDGGNNNIYIVILVVGIMFIAGRLIWYLICRYKDDNNDTIVS